MAATGNGRLLMDRLLQGIKATGVCGVHLEMHRTNHGAFAFYSKLGFKGACVHCAHAQI